MVGEGLVFGGGRSSEGVVEVFYSPQFCNWACLTARNLGL